MSFEVTSPSSSRLASKNLSRRSQTKPKANSKWIFQAFIVLLIGSALDAYSLGPVPVPWVMQVASLVVIVYMAFKCDLASTAAMRTMVWFVVWAIIVTWGGLFFHDYAPLMPSITSTPYIPFIFLRFLALLSFVGSLYLVYYLLTQGYYDAVVRATVITGTIIALYALYVYVAQLQGWPELPRSRMGTGGGEQAVTFSYTFHRALGSFREPSILAQWLVVPFFLSLFSVRRWDRFSMLLMGLVLLLTGSLSGLAAIAGGMAAAALVTNPFDLKKLKVFSRFILIGALVMLAFTTMVSSNSSEGVDLFEVLNDRIQPILLAGGLSTSNRDYIYEYIAQVPFPWIGVGLGNANLLFGKFLGSNLVGSFISLYFSTLYSTGIIGFLILMRALLQPILQAAIQRKARSEKIFLLLAAYISCLIIFAVAGEEFTFMFALLLALLMYELRLQKTRFSTRVVRGDPHHTTTAGSSYNKSFRASSVLP